MKRVLKRVLGRPDACPLAGLAVLIQRCRAYRPMNSARRSLNVVQR